MNSILSHQNQQESSSKVIAIIFSVREFFKNTSNCLANWSFFSTSAMTSIFDRLEIFNSAFSYDWFEDELFNQIADFLQHLQQCLHLYCESELLDLLIIAFTDSVDAWFDKQSKFISLHHFDIALTKTFSTSIFTHVSSASSAKSQNSIFESTATFRSVISSERSNLSLSTLKTESESAKKSATCRHCKQTFKFKIFFASTNASSMQRSLSSVRLFCLMHSIQCAKQRRSQQSMMWSLCLLRLKSSLRNLRKSMFKSTQSSTHFSWSIQSIQRAKSQRNQQSLQLQKLRSLLQLRRKSNWFVKKFKKSKFWRSNNDWTNCENVEFKKRLSKLQNQHQHLVISIYSIQHSYAIFRSSNCTVKSRAFCNTSSNVDINIENQIFWIYCSNVFVILHSHDSKLSQLSSSSLLSVRS